MKKLLLSILVFFTGYLAFPRFVSAKDFSISPGTSYSPIDVTFGTTISNDISNGLVDYFRSFTNKKPIFRIKDPDTTIFNPNFNTLDGLGAVWFFSFQSIANATLVLNQYNKQALVEIRNYDVSSLTAFKSQHLQIKLHTPGEPWQNKDRAMGVLNAIKPPMLDAYSFSFTENNAADPSIWKSVDTLFDTFFDTGGGYPPNSKLSMSNFAVNSPSGSDPKLTSFQTGVFSAAVVTSLQKQTNSRYAPIRYFIYRDFTSLDPTEQKIIYYFNDFVSKSQSVVWPNACPSCGDPYGNPPYSDPIEIVGLVGKTSGGGYYLILTNASPNNNTAIFPSSATLNTYQFYSTIRGNGNFATAPNKIDFQPYETIVAEASLSQPTIPPTIPPISTPTSTLAPGQPTPTGSGGGTIPPQPPGTTLTPTPISQLINGLIRFTGWNFLAGFDPLFLATILGLIALTIFVFTR